MLDVSHRALHVEEEEEEEEEEENEFLSPTYLFAEPRVTRMREHLLD